jgi:hypothetical protein
MVTYVRRSKKKYPLERYAIDPRAQLVAAIKLT